MPAKRLVILSTHPIQYHAPWFRALAHEHSFESEVWFCHRATPREQADAGFGVEFDWDTALLDGYRHRFLNNRAANPSVNSYSGLDNPELHDLIKNERPAAVLVNGWHYKSAWQAMRTCWRNAIPVMVRSDSNLHTARSPMKRLVKWPYYRRFIPRLDACVAVGTWSTEYFLHYGADPGSIFQVPHVVDGETFERAAVEKDPRRGSLREQWNLPNDEVVYLFAGKFIEKKRPMDFVQAIELACHTDNRVSGLMVGDGPLRATCQKYVQSRKLPITFAGFLNQSQIVDAYVAADALILPSDAGETWGLVVNEAMTCGLPCFVSDQVGCGVDLVEGKNSGEIFALGNQQKLADLMVAFARDADRRKQMSDNARRVIQAFSIPAAVAGTVAAFSHVTTATATSQHA